MLDIVKIILKWCEDPDKYKGFQGPIGTDSAYPRWKLREMAGINDVPDHIKEKYPFSNDAKYSGKMKRTLEQFDLFTVDLEDACLASKSWSTCLASKSWPKRQKL